MKINLICVTVLAIFGAVSCSPDTPASSNAGPTDTALTPPPSATVNHTASEIVAAPASHAPVAPVATPAVDAPPKDARFTIYCLSLTGPDHTARADQVKLLWQQATNRSDWYVVHQEDQSLVYFGYYKAIDGSSRDAARALADRKMIQSLTDSTGDQPFAQALLLPLDAPDPTAPPQWNLLNAKGAWTLEIAVYQGRDRKQAAVDSVRQARAQGIEAYYYHGPSASSVCIGTWPEEAVAVEHASVQSSDPSQPLIVVPDELASRMPDSATDENGNRVQVAHPGATIADPTLAAAMQKYPQHSVNGYVDMVSVNGKLAPRQSAVVRIPSSGATAASPTNAPQKPAVDLLGGGNTDDGGTNGHLRSLGN
jgi:hypothetical protein